jgi:Family of unknown function (DUF5906)
VVSINIGEHGYDCNSAVVGAFNKFVDAIGLPYQSMIVRADGKLYYCWTLDRPLTLAEWLPLAHALAEAAKRHGLKCDFSCTTDSTHILPLPSGTVTALRYPTYAPGLLAEKLAPYQVPVPPTQPASASSVDESATLGRVLARYCYIKNIDRVWDKQDAVILNPSQFNVCEASLRSGNTRPYSVFINSKPDIYRSLTYRPGQSEVVLEDYDGAQFECVNTYRSGPDPVFSLSDLRLWIKHGKWLLGRAQFRFIRDYLAWVIQNPGKKPGWVPVIVGPQGVGKDWLLMAFRQALGPHNVAYIEFAHATQRFNADWALKQFVVMNEARQNKPAQAKETYNRIKTITSSLPPTRRIEEKNVPVWHAPNIQAGVVLTNYEDAIALDHDDRRFVVLICVPHVRPDAAEEFFAPLFDWCPRDDEKGEAARAQRRLAGAQLAAYLKQVDLSKFRPEEPPLTQGKQAMISAANPELEWLDSQFSDEGAYCNREVVAANDVLQAWHVHAEVSHNKGVTLNSGAVTAKLRSLEYTARKEAVRVGPSKKIRPWLSKGAMARGLDKRPTEIRDAYLQPASISTAQPGSSDSNVVSLLKQKMLKEAADALGVPQGATPTQIAEARAAKKEGVAPV